MDLETMKEHEQDIRAEMRNEGIRSCHCFLDGLPSCIACRMRNLPRMRYEVKESPLWNS